MDRSRLRWNGWGFADHDDPISRRNDVWGWLAAELGMPSLLATPARALEELTLPPSQLDAKDRQVLNILFPERVREDLFERALHARGRSYQDLLRLRAGDLSEAPDAVVYPRSSEDVLKLLAFASERSAAVVPYGGGTSVVGGVTPHRGQHRAVISVDIAEMDQIEAIDEQSLTVSAQAGIYGPPLEAALKRRGLTLGHYPQSFEFSTLGGWVAHRGAGQASNRYGKAEDWLVGAELATPRGMLRDGDLPATATGPRIGDIVAGSEGVFGVITKATVRVRPAPAAVEGRAYLFRDFARGAAAIRDCVQSETPVATLRLSDVEETRFSRAYVRAGQRRSGWDQASGVALALASFKRPCVLIAQFEGTKVTVRFGRQRFSRIARHHGAIPLGSGPAMQWREARFQAPYLRDPMLDRGLGVDTLETATSWSKLHGLYTAVKAALEQGIAASVPRPGAKGIVMCHISHSYPDGASLYFTYIFPRSLNGDDAAQWLAIKLAASDAVVANGGTISHHHGVGTDHLPWMAQEKGALGIEVLRAIKRTLDPKGILNPGKLIPP
ncbi:MAG: FAD-binding oxidoreductase [Alphaproteobacteria bacterium]|nr:FAD-binding oxidoreductase [Alphaproteobacteria bacterium]